ncbi:hypothetical protein BL254_07430 [Protofrankia sp. BMG5.30]|uniref:Lipoprotein n=1 Tax=Protofrankia coriariae TaxID=1562887 RepID=A0ABR5F858_9ACTN|nr:hypothetical protein FrCorBMG51_01570 [Protofrankia coriariae]ONH36572.1 hypothetical protein BL254_07430 [Protofrankia sp. BMG5.30]
MKPVGYRITVDTTHSPRFRQPRSRRYRRGRVALTTVCAIVIPSTLLLGGCGQNFEQDGGVLPVPKASTEGLRSAIPEPEPAAAEIIGPGYAPPRTSGPTQTAVPNIPGGKH